MVYGRFLFTRGVLAGKVIILGPQRKATVGRVKINDIPIGEPSVSSQHCKLVATDDGFEIEDVGSRNGTFVNGERIQKQLLKTGDVIRLGRSELTYGAFDSKESAQAAGSGESEQVEPAEEEDFPALGVNTEDALPLVSDDQANLLGRIALYNKMVTQEQLDECLTRAQKSEKRLGQVLTESGFLTEENLALLLRIQSSAHLKGEQEARDRQREEDLVNVAQQKGWLHKEQIKHARQIQDKGRRNGLEISLKDILVKKGYLKVDYVRHIQKLQAGESEIAVEIQGYDDYTLLGCGGMGAVYKARQVSMDRQVAIKVLSEQYRDRPKYRERFLNEARSVARLNHENIIAGYDFGEANGISYFVMEYVEGASLQIHLQEKTRLPDFESADIILQVARALSHAHEKGMIHRDIKPENILITEEDFKAKLCDLGLAWSGDDFDSAGRGFGTPNYMSPEQIRGKNLDIRTDIYSLGVTFFRVLFGRLPFQGNTPAQTMTLHLRKALQFPDDTMSPLTRQLATVISRMMAKSASDRYETPRELVSELEEIIEQAAGPPADAEQVNDEVSVGQSAPGEKPSQRVRRRRRRRRR